MIALIESVMIGMSVLGQIPSEQSARGTHAADETRDARWCGKALLAHWVERLEKGDPGERRQAAMTIGLLGDVGDAAVAGLVRAMDDDHSAVAHAAIAALGRIGRPAAAAIPALGLKLGIFHAGQFMGDLDALGLHKGISPVARTLACIGESSVPMLVKTLAEGATEGVRGDAALALSLMGREAKAAVPALIRALKDKDFFVRFYVVQALGRIGPDAKDAMPFLEAALNDDNNSYSDMPDRLYVALDKLGGIARTALEKAIREKRYGMVAFLSETGIESNLAVATLIEALKDDKVHNAACSALARIGPAASTAVPAIIEYLKSNGGVWDCEADALSRIGDASRPAIPLMLQLLSKANWEDRQRILYFIPQIDPYGIEALPFLVGDLKAKDTPLDAKIAICKALGRIGPSAAAAVTAIIDVAKDWDEANARPKLPGGPLLGLRDHGLANYVDARAAAMEALGQIGPAAAAAVPMLIDATKARSEAVRDEAVGALGRVGLAAAAAVPALIELLSTLRNSSSGDDRFLRRTAVIALARIGPPAAAAVPVLTDLLRHGVPFEPETVLALVRIEQNASAAAALERDVEKRMEPFPPSLMATMTVSAALEKKCPELERYLDLLLDQLEEDLLASVEKDSFQGIESDLAHLGDFGHGSIIKVIARLTKLREHPQPLVRRWIRETIAKVLTWKI